LRKVLGSTVSKKHNVLAALGLANKRNFMASRAANNTFNVYVDDKPVEVDGSYTVYQACT
jgi:hypothetical protein